MNNEITKIRNIVGSSDFIKGRTYPKYYIDFHGVKSKNDEHTFVFNVESERTYDFYKVQIIMSKGNINNVKCTCPQFKTTGSCKHVAACLIHYREDIFLIDPKERALNISQEIMNYFKPKEVKHEIKKQVNLEVTIAKTYRGFQLALRVGFERLYAVRHRLGDLLRCYKEQEGTIEKVADINTIEKWIDTFDKVCVIEQSN